MLRYSASKSPAVISLSDLATASMHEAVMSTPTPATLWQAMPLIELDTSSRVAPFERHKEMSSAVLCMMQFAQPPFFPRYNLTSEGASFTSVYTNLSFPHPVDFSTVVLLFISRVSIIIFSPEGSVLRSGKEQYTPFALPTQEIISFTSERLSSLTLQRTNQAQGWPESMASWQPYLVIHTSNLPRNYSSYKLPFRCHNQRNKTEKN